METRVILLVFMLSILALDVQALENLSSRVSQETGIEGISTIKVSVDRDGIVSVVEELSVAVNDVVRRFVPASVMGLEIRDSSDGLLPYETIPRDDMQLVAFVIEDGREKVEKVKLSYRTHQFTSKAGNTWTMNYSVIATSSASSQGTTIKLYTPNGTQIVGLQPKDFWFTPRGESEIWIYPIVEDFRLDFDYVYSGTSTTTTTLGKDEGVQGDNYLVPIVVFFSVLIIAIILFSRQRPSRDQLSDEMPEIDIGVEDNAGSAGAIATSQEPVESSQGFASGNEELEVEDESAGLTVKEAPGREDSPDKGERTGLLKASIKNMMDPNELAVIGLLESSEGEITQAYVYKTTGIPKSSLSEVIKRLEKRNIIERKKEGRTNWIKLKDWVYE